VYGISKVDVFDFIQWYCKMIKGERSQNMGREMNAN
jgi:hypothetical protein